MPSKATYHHGNLKPALIAAALKEISREGPEGFSLRGVARRAGVSAPAVYRHFADKDALLAAVAAECQDRLGAEIAERMKKVAPNDPLEQFRAIGISIVTFAAANPEHYRAMSLPGVYGTGEASKHHDHVEQRAGVAAAIERGEISKLPADDVMLAATALVNGLAHLIIEGQLGDVSPERAEKLAIAATGVLGVGLIPRDEDVDDPQRGLAVKGRKKAR
ncbi:MAG: TetR/AcrR family transcriptional regulator [Kofleriaceae bacterium]|nr:TetR/AcrR family transcriptional regulator [Kofleriaceae bacterium]